MLTQTKMDWGNIQSKEKHFLRKSVDEVLLGFVVTIKFI